MPDHHPTTQPRTATGSSQPRTTYRPQVLALAGHGGQPSPPGLPRTPGSLPRIGATRERAEIERSVRE